MNFLSKTINKFRNVRREPLYNPDFIRDKYENCNLQIVRIGLDNFNILVNAKYIYVDTWMSGDTYAWSAKGLQGPIDIFVERFGDKVIITRDDRL